MLAWEQIASSHLGPGLLLEKLDLELDSEVHQARTWKSHRESLDIKMKFDWDLLPGCSRWLGFIKHKQTYWGWAGGCYVYHSGIRKVCCTENLSRSKQIYSGFHSVCIPGCRAVLAYELICLTVWITSCPLFTRRELYREEVSERNKRERRYEQLVWSGGTVPPRGRGRSRGEDRREPWKRPGAISHPSCQRA